MHLGLLKKSCPCFLFAIFLLGSATGLKAQEATPSSDFGLGSMFKSPPLEKSGQWSEILENKERLSPEDLKKKRERGYFVPIPLLAYDPDIGWGTGMRVYYFANGPRQHPLFPFTPYFHSAYAQVFLTTKNTHVSLLNLDSPYLGGSLFRLRMRFVVARNPNSNYFHLGKESLGPLELPPALQEAGKPHSFSHFKEYDKALQTILPNGVTYAKYYKYTHQVTSWQLTLERDFGGVFRVLGGFRFEKSEIEDYSGRKVEVAPGKHAIMGTTLLKEDEQAGKILGFQGGFDNVLKFGVAYDTRDYEPDPNRGIFADFTVEASEPFIGSDFDYTRTSVALRGYHSPFPQAADLVLAGRVLYFVYHGEVPFFNMATVAITQGKFRGLGGRRSLRGFKQDRFVGKVGAMANFELRWAFAETQLFGQNFAFLFTPFVDMGKV